MNLSRARGRGVASKPLGIDDSEPLKQGDVTKPLVGTDELVNGDHLVEVEGNAKLKGIERANLSAKTVVRDEISGTVVVNVEQPEDLISAACHVSRKEAAEPGKFRRIELPGADLDGKDGDRRDQRQTSDE
jgi:hypothetical protein